MKAKTEENERYQALLQVLRTAETLWNCSRIFFARWQLSPSQFNLLNLLAAPPHSASQTDLSRKLLTHRSNVTGLIDRLEKRGLLRRSDDPGDRRAYRVRLTPRGEKLLQEILPHYLQAATEVWQRTPLPEVRSVLNSLERLADNAERAVAPIRGKGKSP